MSSKRTIMIGMILGSTLGGWLPSLWGAGAFSLTSILLATVGGLLGIWIGYRIANG